MDEPKKTPGARMEENLGLAALCAKRLSGRGLDYEELLSAGYVGLAKAAQGFDETRGFRFSTYAVPFILGEMRQALRGQTPLEVSRALRRQAGRCAQVHQEFLLSQGREPTVSEICARTGLSSAEIAQTLEAFTPPAALETFALEGGVQPGQEGGQARAILRVDLHRALARLSGRDRALIWLRYGLEYTQQKTARALGVSQAQVSRREKAILLSLRRWLE